MKRLAIAFAVIVLLLAGFITWQAWCSKSADILAIGNFLVLTFTLVVLVWYAYDTNAIARVTQQRWSREGVLSTTYSLQLVGAKGQEGRTLVQLHNPSTLVVRARINFNFRVYGEVVTAGPLYDGKQLWLLFPQQMSQGWFEIESLLQMKGKTVSAMVAECTPANSKDQLTMLLELEFSDEQGAHRKLPPRQTYFDFERWAWIPQLGESTSA